MNTRYRRFRRPLVALWIAVALATLAFASSLWAQGAPTLTLVSPQDGATVDGPVTVQVTHSNFRFDGLAVNKDPAPGTGHWHVYVDGKYAGLAVSDVLQIPNEAFPTISAGQHTMTISLHENNHAATNPPVQHDFKLNFSKDLSVGGATPATAGTTTAPPMATSGAMPMSSMPNTGQENGSRITALLAVLACMLGGALLVYWSRRSRARP